MHPCLILGSGRSGTSMVAGLFRGSDSFRGFDLIEGTPANPGGYFEDRILNTVNDLIIGRILGRGPLARLRGQLGPVCHRDSRAFWLAAPRRLRSLQLSRELQRLMRIYASRSPFCYKDPRFSVTLPYWRPVLPPDTRLIVVFRDPHRSVDSQLRDAGESYQPPLDVPASWAYTSWHRNYRRVMEASAGGDSWFFVHYDQVAGGGIAVRALERFVEAHLDEAHLQPGLSRARPVRHVGGSLAARCEQLYGELQQRSRECLNRWASR